MTSIGPFLKEKLLKEFQTPFKEVMFPPLCVKMLDFVWSVCYRIYQLNLSILSQSVKMF